MSKPTGSTEWASDSTALKADPSSDQRAYGWSTSDNTINGVPVKPNLQQQNGWQKNVHDWVSYLDGQNDELQEVAPAIAQSLVANDWTNLRNWTNMNSPNESYTWTNCIWSNVAQKFVAVAEENINPIASSANGYLYNTIPLPNVYPVALAENDSILLCAGGGGVYTSTDGDNWTARTSASSEGWWRGAWGSDTFVIVAQYQLDSSNQVQTSPDGITWTGRGNLPNCAVLYDVVYSEYYGRFFAVGAVSTGTAQNCIWSSSDSSSWVQEPVGTITGATPYTSLNSIAIDENGVIVISSDSNIWRSPDYDLNFTALEFDLFFRTPTYTQLKYIPEIGRWLVVSLDGSVYSSTDSEYWISTGPNDNTASLRCCDYSPVLGMWFLVSGGGTQRFWRSL